jgi:hypothetical protein
MQLNCEMFHFRKVATHPLYGIIVGVLSGLAHLNIVGKMKSWWIFK